MTPLHTQSLSILRLHVLMNNTFKFLVYCNSSLHCGANWLFLQKYC